MCGNKGSEPLAQPPNIPGALDKSLALRARFLGFTVYRSDPGVGDDHPDLPSNPACRDGRAEAHGETDGGAPEVLQESVAGQWRGTRSCLRGRVGAPESTHLRVLEEGVLVVDAAPTAVLPRILVPRPGPTQPGLLPRLVDAQVRCVDQAALDDVGEVSAHVLEGHPGRDKGLSQAGPPTALAGPLSTRPACSEP